MGSNGRTRLEVEANGALSPVAEDLREESMPFDKSSDKARTM